MDPITLPEMKSIRLMNRMDTKFVTHTRGLLALLQLTKESYYIQEIDGVRVAAYRTVYWDGADYPFYQRHQCGKLPRTKIRARTYVDSDLSFLEIKKKNNHGKTKKKRIEVPSIDAVIRGEIGDEFVMEKTGLEMNTLHPAVGNHFNRITLVNKGKTERLTIDFDVQFDNFETGRGKTLDNIVIIELKRDGRLFSPVLAMLRELRIKPCGFSKYCMGMCYTADGIRINRFKRRMRRVAHISKSESK